MNDEPVLNEYDIQLKETIDESEDLDNTEVKGYSVYQRHIDYLAKINPNNSSIALRQSIDRLIKLDEQVTKKQFLQSFKDNLLIISIGMIFLLFGIVSTNILTIILSLGIGIFFCVYGFLTMRFRKL